MKTLIYSLFLASIFVLSTNANTRQSDSLKTDKRITVDPDTRDTVIIVGVDKFRTYKVESDIDPIPPTSFSDRGDLYRLTQNIYASFLLYQTGRTRVSNPNPMARRAYVIGDEEDVVIARRYYADSLKIIPLEAVKSIEVMMEPLIMFAFPDDICVIKVGLKDKELYERVTYIPEDMIPKQ